MTTQILNHWKKALNAVRNKPCAFCTFVLHSVFIYCCSKLMPQLTHGSTKTLQSHWKFLHWRSSHMNTALQGNSQCPLTVLPRRNPSRSPMLPVDSGQTHLAQSLSCHTGQHGPRRAPFAMPAHQHCLHWPPSLCQMPGLLRSVKPALAGGWGRKCWKHNAPWGTPLPSLHILSWWSRLRRRLGGPRPSHEHHTRHPARG